MNFTDWQAPDQTRLEWFYDADQVWTWKNIQAREGGAARVMEWLYKCPEPRRHPLVLPYCRKEDRVPRWLCIAFSEMQCEELREHLNAFIGTAGCDFEGRRSTLPQDDRIAAIAREWAGGNRIFDFGFLTEAHRQEGRARLERMLRVWALRPETDRTSLRTTEALLREFHLALVNGDEASATSWLEELRAGGRLSEENRLFLKMEIPAAAGRWSDIDLDPDMALLAAAHRPRRTTAILIETLWHTALAEKVAADDVAGALDIMRARLTGPLRGLFRSPAGLTRPHLLLTFLIAAAADAQPRHNVIQALIERLPDGSPELAFGGKIIAAIAPVPAPAPVAPANPFDLVWDAIRHDDFLGAWLLLKPLPNSPDRCRLLLQCADEHWDEDTVPVITTAMAALTETERAGILAKKRLLLTWEKISAPTTEAAPSPVDWESWLAEVAHNPEWDQAISYARDTASLWSPDAYRSSPAKIRALCDLLGEQISAPAGETVRLCLPYIARSFLADGPQSTFRPLYQELLFMQAMDNRFGAEDWGLAETLASSIIEIGLSPEDYKDLLSSLTVIWRERADPRRMDWALDFLDLFTAIPCPDPGARDEFFECVSESIIKHARRLTPAQFSLFKLLCEDLGREFPAHLTAAAEAVAEAPSDLLSRKTVAIYTLNESSAKRAAALISTAYPGSTVLLNHDHAGSDHLKHLARTADYFLMVTRSAKHAATNFIKAERPPGKRPVDYPAGKGSSSIFSALRMALEG